MKVVYPLLKTFDENGKPLVGGRVYTYANGTTDSAESYANFELTAKQKNPIELNADGESQVYLAESESVKFVAKDADNAILWTADRQNYPSQAPPTSRIDKFKAYDHDGNPLAGGKLYIYHYGTSRLATTFSDPALTVKNTNPVILDANGEADIYFENGVDAESKSGSMQFVGSVAGVKS